MRRLYRTGGHVARRRHLPPASCLSRSRSGQEGSIAIQACRMMWLRQSTEGRRELLPTLPHAVTCNNQGSCTTVPACLLYQTPTPLPAPAPTNTDRRPNACWRQKTRLRSYFIHRHRSWAQLSHRDTSFHLSTTQDRELIRRCVSSGRDRGPWPIGRRQWPRPSLPRLDDDRGEAPWGIGLLA